MPAYEVVVDVMLKPEILDPAGQAVVNALPSLGLPSVGAPLAAGCLVALAAGAVLGAPLARRVSEAAARRTTLVLAAIGGATVLARAVVG